MGALDGSIGSGGTWRRRSTCFSARPGRQGGWTTRRRRSGTGSGPTRSRGRSRCGGGTGSACCSGCGGAYGRRGKRGTANCTSSQSRVRRRGRTKRSCSRRWLRPRASTGATTGTGRGSGRRCRGTPKSLRSTGGAFSGSWRAYGRFLFGGTRTRGCKANSGGRTTTGEGLRSRPTTRGRPPATLSTTTTGTRSRGFGSGRASGGISTPTGRR